MRPPRACPFSKDVRSITEGFREFQVLHFGYICFYCYTFADAEVNVFALKILEVVCIGISSEIKISFLFFFALVSSAKMKSSVFDYKWT